MPRKLSSGFTLVEITVVVALIAILLAAGAKIATGLIEGAANSSSAKKQQSAKEALTNYLGRNRRLPCPDTDRPADGRENRAAPGTTADDCTSEFGTIPYGDLGIPRETALDGWQNYFSYHVADPGPGNFRWNKSGAFSDTRPGTLIINDRDAAGNPLIPILSTNVVAVVVSHGRDGSGAITFAGTQNAPPPPGTDENINALGAAARPVGQPHYWVRQPTDNAAATGGPFNDLVMFLRPEELITPLLMNNQLAPQIGTANQQVNQARSAAMGFVLSTMGAQCLLPPTLAAMGIATLNDPWGNPYTLTNGAVVIAQGAPFRIRVGTAAGPALTIASNGPNGVAGDADDVSAVITVGEFQGYLGNINGPGFAASCP